MSETDENGGELPARSRQEIVEELERLPEEERQEILGQVVVETRELKVDFHKGPIPPAEEFRKYEAVQPGAADRILRIAEKEQDIRAEQVSGALKLQEGGLKIQRLTLKLSTLVALCVLGIAGLAAWGGQPIIAIPLGLAGFAALFIKHIAGAIKN